jgi:integrase
MTYAWEAFLRVSDWKSDYPSVDRLLRFLKNRKNGSEGSRSIYCRAVHGLCMYTGKMPDDLVSLKKAEVEKLVDDFCYHKKENGCCSRTVNTIMALLKAFFKVNGFKGSEEIEVEFYHRPTRLRTREEYIPTLEEARRMANVAGSLRNRAIILFMFSTGLRNSTLRAITCGDVKKELESGQSNLLVKVHMGMKNVVEAACKGNIEYSVFCSADATEALKLYLAYRRGRIGEVSEAEILFCSEHNIVPRNERACKPLTSREVEIIVTEAARKAGIEKWKNVTPHCLRKTFESILRSRLDDGSRLDVKTQEYFMGHILPRSQDTYYDKTKIEELRKEYSKLIFKSQEHGKAIVLESIKTMTEALGIDSGKLLASKEKEIGRELDDEERLAFLKEATKEYLHQIRESKTKGESLPNNQSALPDSNAQNPTAKENPFSSPVPSTMESSMENQERAEAYEGDGCQLKGLRVNHVDYAVKLELESLAAVFYHRKMSPKEIKARMAFLIGKVGMNPKEVAKETGMSLRTIYRYTPQKLKNQAKVKAGRISGYTKPKLLEVATTNERLQN